MKKKREEFKKVDRNVQSNISNLLYESIKMNENTKFPLSTCLFLFTPRKKVLKTGYFPLAQCHIVFYKKEKNSKLVLRLVILRLLRGLALLIVLSIILLLLNSKCNS